MLGGVGNGVGDLVGVMVALLVGVEVEGLGLFVGSRGRVAFVHVGETGIVSNASVLVGVQEADRIRINNKVRS